MQPNKDALYVILKSSIHTETPGSQLALHVQIWPGHSGFKETLCFYDTMRGHMILGSMTSAADDSFIFTDKEGCQWEFKEVTLEMYKSQLSASIVGGREVAKQISSTQELWLWYREHFSI